MNGKQKIYATIDTNVLVSALLTNNSSSNPSKVIESVINGIITPLYNDEIIAEYKDVLSRKKFKFKPSLIEDFLSFFTTFGIKCSRTPISGESFPDSDDIVFYEITMSVNDAYLITGNTKHFPEKPFIVTPAQMVEILTSNGLLEK